MSLLVMLLIATGCALIGSALVPGGIPGGLLGAMVVGLLGAFLGVRLLGSFGPGLVGVSLVPTILGSALLVLLYTLVSRRFQ